MGEGYRDDHHHVARAAANLFALVGDSPSGGESRLGEVKHKPAVSVIAITVQLMTATKYQRQ